jgi:hypothetical protein
MGCSGSDDPEPGGNAGTAGSAGASGGSGGAGGSGGSGGGGACEGVDTTSDPNNCGGCEFKCATGAKCIASKCECPTGTKACGAECLDTVTDPNNCGSCGVVCSPSESCDQGACKCTGSPGVSFAADVQPILTASCAKNTCHAGATPAQGMNLEDGQAYAALVGTATLQCDGQRTRVVAGATDQSYLINKLRGVGMCTGQRMPRNNPPLKQDELDAIAGWICAGAKDD